MASASPASLFANGEPGAWFDPSDLTTLFQDSAGTTPVTTPGQTVGLMLDKSKNGIGANGAFCRNLLTYTEAFTNATWLTQGGSWSAVDANGFQTFTEDTAMSQHRLYDDAYSVVSGKTYTLSAQVAYGTRRWVFLAFYDGVTTVTAWFDLLDGVKGSVTAGVTSTMTTVSSGVYNITLTKTAGATSSAANVQIGPQLADGETVGWTGTGAVTRIAKYQFELGSTATAYQPITSSWAATIPGNHATQATLAQRPIYGINPIVGTRNLLTYTEQFDNAVWVKTNTTVTANAAVAPDGTTTADKVAETATTASHYVYEPYTSTGVSVVSSVYAKASERRRIAVWEGTTSANGAVFDLISGTVVNNLAAGVGSIQSVGDGWYRCSVTSTETAGTRWLVCSVLLDNATGVGGTVGVAGSGILIWGAQLELGSTATAYQKVVSKYEVTEAGVQSVSYLAFDGIDDGMVTNTITPNIDKVQVFAGVRKLSDAARAMLVELGPPTATGTFRMEAPSTASPNYFLLSTGTSSAGAGPVVTYTAPITNVLTGLGDISGDTVTLRINATQVGQSTADQGTGNYSTAVIYIGRRGGTSLPFNGRLYSLITRFGPNLTTGQITSTESWVNSRTGAY